MNSPACEAGTEDELTISSGAINWYCHYIWCRAEQVTELPERADIGNPDLGQAEHLPRKAENGKAIPLRGRVDIARPIPPPHWKLSKFGLALIKCFAGLYTVVKSVQGRTMIKTFTNSMLTLSRWIKVNTFGKLIAFLDKKMHVDQYLYLQSTPRKIIRTWCIAGFFIVLCVCFLLFTFSADTPIYAAIPMSNGRLGSALPCVLVMFLFFHFFFLYINNLQYALWVTQTQFYIRTTMPIPNSVLSSPEGIFDFSKLTHSQSGDSDISWTHTSPYDDKRLLNQEGISFCYEGTFLISAVPFTLDITPSFIDSFVAQIRLLRPDLTTSPDLLKRMSNTLEQPKITKI